MYVCVCVCESIRLFKRAVFHVGNWSSTKPQVPHGGGLSLLCRLRCKPVTHRHQRETQRERFNWCERHQTQESRIFYNKDASFQLTSISDLFKPAVFCPSVLSSASHSDLFICSFIHKLKRQHLPLQTVFDVSRVHSAVMRMLIIVTAGWVRFQINQNSSWSRIFLQLGL